jgi:hypothetical protein
VRPAQSAPRTTRLSAYRAGDELTVLETDEISGWSWVRRASGREGWVPNSTISQSLSDLPDPPDPARPSPGHQPAGPGWSSGAGWSSRLGPARWSCSRVVRREQDLG